MDLYLNKTNLTFFAITCVTSSQYIKCFIYHVVLSVTCVPDFVMIVDGGLSNEVWLTDGRRLFPWFYSDLVLCLCDLHVPYLTSPGVILRRVRGLSRRSLLFHGTYSHTWVSQVFVLSFFVRLIPGFVLIMDKWYLINGWRTVISFLILHHSVHNQQSWQSREHMSYSRQHGHLGNQTHVWE